MAKTAILTKDGLVRYDSNIKDYIKDLTDDAIYIDPDETSSEIENIDSVTSAKYVSYSNANSGLEATNVQEAIDTTTSIVKGKNRARVFSTTEDMNTWLSDEANKGIALVGDNLYIVALDVPDWWISEVLEEADAETGFYYKIAQLETQKVDLTSIQEQIAGKVNTADIVDNLESTATDAPLSANQGRILNETINTSKCYCELLDFNINTTYQVNNVAYHLMIGGKGLSVPMIVDSIGSNYVITKESPYVTHVYTGVCSRFTPTNAPCYCFIISNTPIDVIEV